MRLERLIFALAHSVTFSNLLLTLGGGLLELTYRVGQKSVS